MASRHAIYGRQPARVVIFTRDIEISTLDQHMVEHGSRPRALYKVLGGYCLPNPVIVDELPKLLDLPLTELFTAEVLEAVAQR